MRWGEKLLWGNFFGRKEIGRPEESAHVIDYVEVRGWVPIFLNIRRTQMEWTMVWLRFILFKESICTRCAMSKPREPKNSSLAESRYTRKCLFVRSMSKCAC